MPHGHNSLLKRRRWSGDFWFKHFHDAKTTHNHSNNKNYGCQSQNIRLH
jgi:hypothetical protein